MGNVLCKNRTNRSSNTSNAKNPVDRVIGECMQMCPNGIRKKKHFWEKQVLETAPPQEPLQEQPKLKQKNGWQSANLTVPDHPVAPPRKKRTLQRNIDPSDKNAFEEIYLNEEISEKYNERSVDPPETPTITTTTTTIITNTTTNTTTLTNKVENNTPQKVTRAVSKVGNKKSDKFFGESLSDLSTDYDNNETIETAKNIVNTKPTAIKNETEINEKSISNSKSQETNISKNDNENLSINNKTSKNDEIVESDNISTEATRESVVNLVEDIEEELNRKIIKERGNLMFSMEKHLSKMKTDETEDRFKDEKPVVEELIVPVKKVRHHVCDDDEKIREIVKDHSSHPIKREHENDEQNDNKVDHVDPINAPRKPQRDFAKYRKSLNGDDFDTSQIIEAVNVMDQKKILKEKKENSTQTTGKLAVREKAHHARQEAENISKNVKALIRDSKGTNDNQTVNTEKLLDSTILDDSTDKLKSEMKNFINNIEKLQTEIHESKALNGQNHDEIEIAAEHLVNNILDSAQNSINSAKLNDESNRKLEKNLTKTDDENLNANNSKENYSKKPTQDLISKSEVITSPAPPQIIKEKKKDYLEEVIAAPIQNLSEKTTAALKEAQALKEELNLSLLSNSASSEIQHVHFEKNIQSEKPEEINIQNKELSNDKISDNVTTEENNNSNNQKSHFIKEKSVEDCIDCMKKDAVKVIHEVVEYAEKIVKHPHENFAQSLNDKSNNNDLPNGLEETKIRKLMKKPSVILFEENGTHDFITALKKDASQTINDVCKYAEKTVEIKMLINGENKENINDETIIDSNKSVEMNDKIDLTPSTEETINLNAPNYDNNDLIPPPDEKIYFSTVNETIILTQPSDEKINLTPPIIARKNIGKLRPNRVSEITPPTQIQARVYRRSFSTQSVENDSENNVPQPNDDIFNEIFSTCQADQEKSKSTNNILDNDKPNPRLPPRPTRFSDINKPSLINSEKILRRCLSTQSYLTPNLIEKIAIQANILSMPDPEDMGTNDGSSLVSPIYRLESKRPTINSQSSLNSEKSADSADFRASKTAIVPPLPPKKPLKEENIKTANEENIILNTSLNNQNHKKDASPLSTPPRELKITSPKSTKSPITTRSPSPARPSRIPELPKSKLTKRLSRSTSKQSNPDLTDLKKSQELSEMLNKFLNEKDLKPQEILDLIEFEFGDCMFSELIPENDKKIISELRKSVMRQQQKSSQQFSKPPQKSPPSRSASRELLVRQNSQSSDSSSSKKSPDHLKTSRIPVFKNNKTQELQNNNNSDFRRHSIDDLDSWFNPIKINLKEKHRLRKRDNSLQLDYDSAENSMNSSLVEPIAIKQSLHKTPRTKSTNDLSKSTVSFSLTPTNQSQQNNNNNPSEHSALLKYLDNKN